MYQLRSRRRRSPRIPIALAVVATAALVLAMLVARSSAQTSAPMPVIAVASAVPGTPATGQELSTADGYLPGDETFSPFDISQPAIANLKPALWEAIQQAATDAQADNIHLVITSGWRSKRYQQELLDEAVVTYGSLAEARKWVNTPNQSTHVSGDAVDVGPTDAAYWLIQYGNEYGLCQIYANEIWHFELKVNPGGTCPAPRTDASGG